MEANSGSDEVMKRWNINYGKKLIQWSNEAFNAGVETEAMKRLTLHHFIASLLLLPSFGDILRTAVLHRAGHNFCCLLKSPLSADLSVYKKALIFNLWNVNLTEQCLFLN
jgi:hypothetical protein